MNTTISENDGSRKILGRLSTLALVASPHSIKVKPNPAESALRWQ